MIHDFRDVCLWSYVVIDDLWQQVKPLVRHPGPEPVCSDSELMTLAIVGECWGWDQETELLQRWQEYRDLFPHLPERSRFNRRRRNLAQAFNLVRRVILDLLDVALDCQCVIDSVPVPVMQFHLVPVSHNDWKAYGATYGRVESKRQTIFGYKLELLITLGGVILDFELVPANADEREVAAELLEPYADLIVLADKALISADLATTLRMQQDIRLLTLPRRNQHQQLPKPVCRQFTWLRQRIETVNSQLSEQFHIERNHAYSFSGLTARLLTKLAAHTVQIYLNRLLGSADFLQIKKLAFPYKI